MICLRILHTGIYKVSIIYSEQVTRIKEYICTGMNAPSQLVKRRVVNFQEIGGEHKDRINLIKLQSNFFKCHKQTF